MKTPQAPSVLWLAGLLALGTLSRATTALPVHEALAARSGDGTAMRFTPLPADATGLRVENPYDDPAMWGGLYREFQGGAIGTGLAVGDLNGDGLPDLYVVNKTRPNQVFLQTSPFHFEDVSARAGAPGGPTWKTGATLADVDNDGDLDLYVCQFRGPNLLYLNDGHAVFTEAAARAGVALVSGSTVGAFADYDRDGDLDLFVVTNVMDATAQPDGEPDHLYRNNGNGTFTDVTSAAGLPPERARGHSATWFDANGDGWSDLFVANDFNQPDHLYQNNGDGTFTDVTSRAFSHLAWFSMGADFGDLNNDSQLDLMVADMAGTTHYKSKVTMGDMGGLVDYMDGLATPQYMKNAVYLNSGTDRFLEVAKLTGLSSTDWTWSLRFEDLDNDGWLDLHVTNGMVRSFINSDLVDKTRTLQSEQEIISLLKASPVLKETHLTFRNDHALKFKKVQADWGLDHQGVSFGSAFADFDRDGDLDLVYVNFEDTVSLYRNDSPAGHRATFSLRGTRGNRFGVGATLIAETSAGRQTRQLAVARGALSSSEPLLHFGLGDDTEIARLEVRWPSGESQIFTHLPADQHYTLTEPASDAQPAPAVGTRAPARGLFSQSEGTLGLDFVNRERPFNDMTRQSLLPNRMNTLGGGLAKGDVNGDGREDVLCAGAAGNPSVLFLGQENGGFARVREFQAWGAFPESEAMCPLLLDLDGDGDLDVLLSSGSVEAEPGSDYYLSHVYLNNGYGVFAEDPSRLQAPPFSAGPAAAADFDHDGDLDVFLAGRVNPGEYPSTPPSFLLENRDGRLVPASADKAPSFQAIGMVSAALWTDYDSDGWPDLLLAGEWMPLRLFHNVSGRLVEVTEAAGLAGTSGWWNTLVAADVNEDGALDYVAGNTGLNTKYSADAKHPVSIYYMDVEGRGRKEIVEAKFEGEKPIPVRGRSCSSRAMPSLKRKFPTYHAFGSALLPEIYTEQKLSEAFYVAATELASGVFLNDGHGKFTFKPFPRLAQTAPVFGIECADFDGDGHLDLFLAQNFSGPQVETGRYNGALSLVLHGDGHGAFLPLTAVESGVTIPQDARGTLTSDLNQDGWPDLLVSRLQSTPAVLLSHPSDQARSWCLRLEGPKGNPLASGAQIRVLYAAGDSRLHELTSGSGYLSHNGATFFVSETAAHPIASLEVTWPDGQKTRHALPKDATRMVLRAPARLAGGAL